MLNSNEFINILTEKRIKSKKRKGGKDEKSEKRIKEPKAQKSTENVKKTPKFNQLWRTKVLPLEKRNAFKWYKIAKVSEFIIIESVCVWFKRWVLKYRASFLTVALKMAFYSNFILLYDYLVCTSNFCLNKKRVWTELFKYIAQLEV